MTYQINQHSFKNKKEIKEFVQYILNKNSINGNDRPFLLEFFKRHPHYDVKAGAGIKDIKIENRCFILYRIDNSKIDISYIECIHPKTHKSKILSALRKEIRPQINELNVPKGYEADHVGRSFECLANAFMSYIGENNIKLSKLDGLEFGHNLADEQQRRIWKEFHKRAATIEVIPKEEHLKRTKERIK